MTRLGVLGPVMAWTATGRAVALGGPKDRSALAVLALSANRVCSEGELIDSIWGDEPPDGATNLLHNQIFRLRKVFRAAGEASPIIVTRPGGYELVATAQQLDLIEAEGLLADARAAAKHGRHEVASDLIGRALACWRGVPLADLGDLPFVTVAQAHLGEMRIGALEAGFEAELACGRHGDQLGQLEAATAAAPLRERLWELRLTALYRAGRQADALRAYQELRGHLDEVGLVPSPALSELERSILRQSPDLDWHPVELPSGTVAFLQTNVEGSTQLFHQLGGAYPAVLADHDALVRAAVARSGGIEVSHDADRFLFAFADPTDAVRAALAVQLALGRHAWPAPMPVRIGVHAGPATPTGFGYVALARHQVARLTTAAHGGQVLVSEGASAAVARSLPDGASLIDLGPHQLRDFPAPERVFQLSHPDLAARFGPLRSAAVIRHNLPQLRSRFVGRAEDVSELARLLERTGVVSVVGSGGVGKTRVAVETARAVLPRFGDGAWLVELGPLADGEQIGSAIAAALGVTELPGRPVLDAIVDDLADRRTLLILDNCEHLVDAVAAVVETLAGRCAGLGLLTTSRVPLRADGEAVWRLAPLHAPEPGADHDVASLVRFEAVELFCDRAALAQPTFALDAVSAAEVAAVTGRLDGIPLALELAAARLVDLDLTALEAGLADRFRLLSMGRRNAPTRQQTLWAAIEWSFRLLDDDSRALLVSLAPFAGPFDREAAAAVAELPEPMVTGRLDRLVELSLLDLVGDRYRLLETIRAFALEQLNQLPAAIEVRNRHLAVFAGRAEAAEPHLGAPDPDWLTTVERDTANYHEAMRWALTTSPGQALRLGAAIYRAWEFRGRHGEMLLWLEEALAKAGAQADHVLRARALLAIGALADGERSLACRRQAVDLLRGAGDDARLANALCDLFFILLMMEHHGEAEAILPDAMAAAQAAEDPMIMANVAAHQSAVAVLCGRHPDAIRLLEGCVPVYRQAGAWQELMWTLGELGWILMQARDFDGVPPPLREALDLAVTLHYPQGEAWARTAFAIQRYLVGDLAGARQEVSLAIALCRRIDDRMNGPWVYSILARIALAEGNRSEAHALLVDGVHDALKWGQRLQGVCRRMAVLAAACGDAQICAELLGARSAMGEERTITDYDTTDLGWAQAQAQQHLGPEAFNRAFHQGVTADPRRLLSDACLRIDPTKTSGAAAPPVWRPRALAVSGTL